MVASPESTEIGIDHLVFSWFLLNFKRLGGNSDGKVIDRPVEIWSFFSTMLYCPKIKWKPFNIEIQRLGVVTVGPFLLSICKQI